MARTWKLDTETKGTGAHIAPLRDASAAATRERPLAVHSFRAPSRAGAAPERTAAAPRRFKVVDVMSARVLGEELALRPAIALVAGAASPLDVRVYVRRGSDPWRLLTFAERRALWGLGRGEAGVPPDA